MGKIDIIGKYNLDNKNWLLNSNPDNKISLAVGNYDAIKNNDSSKYDYIVYCCGSRVEDNSKDGNTVEENKAHVKEILDYFKTKKHNIILKFIMLDKDAPLREEANVLAQYIESLYQKEDCNSINIVGFSKSGVLFFEMIKYINAKYYNKINLYNIATPYTGTKMASIKLVYADIKRLIESHIPGKALQEKIYSSVINIYEGISSNSHMDYDISLPNGIPEDRLDKYDETLIANLLQKDNIDAVSSLNRFENFTTGIDNTTLRRALKTANFTGIGLCLVDDIIMKKNSDGFVHTASEEEVSKYFNVTSKHIKGAHHNVLSDQLYSDEVLYSISENLSEDQEKKLIKKCL